MMVGGIYWISWWYTAHISINYDMFCTICLYPGRGHIRNREGHMWVEEGVGYSLHSITWPLVN